MSVRDRASGWKHAKLTGHKNEERVKMLLDTNSEYANELLKYIGICGNIEETSIGGLHETNVPSVYGKKTKSKTDLKIFLDTKETVNISIKKSLGGQVYLIRAGLFIEAYEKQFEERIPKTVIRAIELFWAAADDAVEIIKIYADKTDRKSYDLQIRHRSLNATTLRNYNINLYEDLLNWFTDNAGKIALLCFAAGAVLDKKEWSKYVWYINLLEENDVDDIFYIPDICSASDNCAVDETYYGDKNGGTTIQLPFGFVQWHQGQLQFHHSYDKIKALLS